MKIERHIGAPLVRHHEQAGLPEADQGDVLFNVPKTSGIRLGRLHSSSNSAVPPTPLAERAASVMMNPARQADTPSISVAEERVARGKFLLQDITAGLRAARPGASLVFEGTVEVLSAITSLAAMVVAVGGTVALASTGSAGVVATATVVHQVGQALGPQASVLTNAAENLQKLGAGVFKILHGTGVGLVGLSQALMGLPAALKGIGLIAAGKLGSPELLSPERRQRLEQALVNLLHKIRRAFDQVSNALVWSLGVVRDALASRREDAEAIAKWVMATTVRQTTMLVSAFTTGIDQVLQMPEVTDLTPGLAS